MLAPLLGKLSTAASYSICLMIDTLSNRTIRRSFSLATLCYSRDH